MREGKWTTQWNRIETNQISLMKMVMKLSIDPHHYYIALEAVAVANWIVCCHWPLWQRRRRHRLCLRKNKKNRRRSNVGGGKAGLPFKRVEQSIAIGYALPRIPWVAGRQRLDNWWATAAAAARRNGRRRRKRISWYGIDSLTIQGATDFISPSLSPLLSPVSSSSFSALRAVGCWRRGVGVVVGKIHIHFLQLWQQLMKNSRPWPHCTRHTSRGIGTWKNEKSLSVYLSSTHSISVLISRSHNILSYFGNGQFILSSASYRECLCETWHSSVSNSITVA